MQAGPAIGQPENAKNGVEPCRAVDRRGPRNVLGISLPDFTLVDDHPIWHENVGLTSIRTEKTVCLTLISRVSERHAIIRCSPNNKKAFDSDGCHHHATRRTPVSGQSMPLPTSEYPFEPRYKLAAFI